MPSTPGNEKERLAALREYQVLDTEAEPEFDEIAGLASGICQKPVSMITLIDHDRVWIKSSVNFAVREMPRGTAFSEHAILSPLDPQVVSDMREDERFKNLPFVKEDPRMVFFAAIPITNREGFALGTLSVLDIRPGVLTDIQLWTLQILAKQIMHLLELRKANLRLISLKSDMESRSEEFQQFAFVVSHDIKSPLASIFLTTEMLRENLEENLDDDSDQLLKVLSRSSLKIRNLVDGVLAWYRSGVALSETPESFGLKPFLSAIAEMFNTNQAAFIQLPEQDKCIFMNKTALEQILVNLIQNGVKHNDKDKPKIQIGFSEDDSYYHFIVTDNGKGIAPDEQKKIIGLFKRNDLQDRFDTLSSGAGLSIVKRLVEKLSGTVLLNSVPGEGSEFSVSIRKK